MNYEEWEKSVSAEITNDSLWKIEAYRLGLFAVDVGWHDATKLMQDIGSARESRDWYYKGRHILGPVVTAHRLSLLTQIIRLLLTMVPQQRQGIVRETGHTYKTENRDTILQDVPFF